MQTNTPDKLIEVSELLVMADDTAYLLRGMDLFPLASQRRTIAMLRKLINMARTKVLSARADWQWELSRATNVDQDDFYNIMRDYEHARLTREGAADGLLIAGLNPLLIPYLLDLVETRVQAAPVQTKAG